LNTNEPPGRFTIRPVPPATLMAQCLHIDALLVHGLQPRRPEHQRSVQLREHVGRKVGIANHVGLFRNKEVTVDVDHFDATISNRDLAPACGTELTAGRAIACCENARGSACSKLEESSATLHMCRSVVTRNGSNFQDSATRPMFK
jgi:hypothetical protein